MRRAPWSALLLLPALLSAQQPVRTFAVARDVSMRIWLPSGTVRVEVWDRDTIRVSGRVGRGAHLFGGGGGQSAKVGVDWDDHSNTALPHGDLVVTVPRQAHVWIKMTDGEVTASGTTGELEVTTVTGTILVQDARGVVSVETIDARVTLARIHGEVRARSGGGRLTLKQIDGTLSAATVTGGVDLSGLALPDARIETISGGISIRGRLGRDALLDLESHSGPITLALDRTAVPLLALTSRGGKVTNPLGTGSIAAGKITAYSFKGSINVVSLSGIEWGKANPPP